MFHVQKNRFSKQRPQGRGFTLVELLVVIVIISILAALITPAVISAIGKARRGSIAQEITLLDAALKNYKNNFGSYPPSTNYIPPPPMGSPRYPLQEHLNKIFLYGASDITLVNLPSTLKGPEILVYCLGGYMSQNSATNLTYSTDKRSPLIGTTKKQALFDFDQSRLQVFPGKNAPTPPTIPNPPYTPASASTLNTVGTPYVVYQFPSYMPPYPTNRTAPYAYFCTSRTGSLSEEYMAPTTDTSRPFEHGCARPYIVNNGATTTVANATSFQIISAGEDGNFGGSEDGTGDPDLDVANGTSGTMSGGVITGHPFPKLHKYNRAQLVGGTTVDFKYYAGSDDDNLTNFYQGRLEDTKQ